MKSWSLYMLPMLCQMFSRKIMKVGCKAWWRITVRCIIRRCCLWHKNKHIFSQNGITTESSFLLLLSKTTLIFYSLIASFQCMFHPIDVLCFCSVFECKINIFQHFNLFPYTRQSATQDSVMVVDAMRLVKIYLHVFLFLSHQVISV